MTRDRKIFWTGVTLALLVGYFVLFFWMKDNKAQAEETISAETVVEATIDASAAKVDPATDLATKLDDDWQYGYFAGGCFWCIEKDFEKLDGIGDVISGYTGGDLKNPTYEQISHKDTGHREAVKVPYDPAVISYRQLVDYFFRHIDPIDDSGQFCDRGPSYLTAIWVQNDEEREAAQASKKEAAAFLNKEIYTPILDVKTFWNAEDRHQNYYKTNSTRYNFYRRGCGRDARVKSIWGK